MNRLFSALLIALVVIASGTPAVGAPPTDPDVKSKKTQTPVRSESATPPSADLKLKADLEKLIAETRTNKIPSSQSFPTHPTNRHHLSKTKKIAIGVAIAVGVVTAVLIIRKPRVTGSAF